MGRALGYTCDRPGCRTFAPVEGKDMAKRPAGWLGLLLPEVDNDPRPEDNVRVFCSDRCVELFARERRVASGGGTTARKPMDEGLRQFLDSKGITGRSRAALAGNHARHHKDHADEHCKICLYYEAAERNAAEAGAA